MKHLFFTKTVIFLLTAVLSFQAKGQKASSVDSIRGKIVYFGSSVPLGEGAKNRKGYTSIFSEILKNRASKSGYAWETVNISIGGDNTVKVLKRYETDLLPLQGNYVVFALALGNEGIHEHGQPMFDQFKKNLNVLINQAKSDGYMPILTNSYTRNDYTKTDYEYIKKMNLLIQQWDVPSINLLGAVDDLKGHWMDGYWADGAHPNELGHAEMAYTIVPSLFDALENKKPSPKRVQGSFIRLPKNPKKQEYIRFSPEQTLHPFTTSIRFKTKGTGTLLEIHDEKGTGTVSLNPAGQLTYSSTGSGTIIGHKKVNDNTWHTLTLTHYYAKGLTLLYADSSLQGTVNERLTTKAIQIGGLKIPKNVAFKDWLFYRSAMNQQEINCLTEDTLLKSSLELYAPLDGKKKSIPHPYSNLAQSMNALQKGILRIDEQLEKE